jgi:cytoskeleton protein RodZ
MEGPKGRPAGGDSLGSELRKQREIRGISLKEIADATKISRRYLEALETDKHDILPAPVLTRGFVREFARYIGLDAEEMADRYSETTRAERAGDEEDPLSHSQPLPWIRIDRNLVIFGLILVAFVVVVWWVWSNMGTNSPDPAPVATNTIEPAVAPRGERIDPEETEVPSVLEPEKLELRVTVVSDTWVILQVDGKPSTNEVLRTGDVRTFTAENEFRFEVVGNAGGIELSLNGAAIPSLGAQGRVVRNLVFDWTYLEGLRGEASGE